MGDWMGPRRRAGRIARLCWPLEGSMFATCCPRRRKVRMEAILSCRIVVRSISLTYLHAFNNILYMHICTPGPEFRLLLPRQRFAARFWVFLRRPLFLGRISLSLRPLLPPLAEIVIFLVTTLGSWSRSFHAQSRRHITLCAVPWLLRRNIPRTLNGFDMNGNIDLRAWSNGELTQHAPTMEIVHAASPPCLVLESYKLRHC